MSDPTKAVFLSYASQDAEAAKKICDALRAAGVEVWFDQSELVGGDAWDQKIRKQIRECALLIPIISKTTQGRREAYFRLEWKLADERTHLMAKGTPFLLPVTIDETSDRDALVPDSFLAVQWTKAPAGETPPAFAPRVKKLLDGDVVGVADPGGSSRRPGPGSPTPATGNSPRWLRPVLASAAIVIAVLAITLFNRRDREPPVNATKPAVGAPAGKTGSKPEVAALLARVRAATGRIDALHTELDTMEDLLGQAARLDPADAAVWLEWALLDCRYLSEYYDPSTARREAARRHAAQAAGLDPGNPLVRFAQASVMRRLTNDTATKAEAVKLLHQLLGELPADGRVPLELAMATIEPGRPEAASELFDRAAQMPGYASWAYFAKGRAFAYRGMLSPAKAEFDRALASERSFKILLWKAYVLTSWDGDLAAARQALAEVPPQFFVEDMPAATRYYVELLSRNYDHALAAMRAVPRDYMQSVANSGPTGFYKGYALALAGKPAAAELEWRSALATVERRLVAQPNDQELMQFKALTQVFLGERTAAAKTWQAEQELYGSGADHDGAEQMLGIQLLPADEAFAGVVRNVAQGSILATAAQLRLDPVYDPIRSQPGFPALLAQAEADPRLSPKAKAKPAEEQKTTDHGPQTTPAAVDAKSVAVLAFANLSDDKNNEYFSDGISEELLNVLAKVPGLKVTARTSSFHFKGKDTPIPEIAKELGVAYVVEGSVRKAGDKVRITAQLIKAADGFHVWSDTFTRDLKDIFAVQDEIAGLIAKNLQLKLGDASRVAKTVNPEAHQLYLQGKYFLNQYSHDNAQRAADLLQRAVELDPEFALAWAALSRSHSVRGGYADLLPEVDESFGKARRAAERALALDPDLAAAHLALAEVQTDHDWDWKGAAESLRRAQALAPTDAGVIDTATRLAYAVGQRERAAELGGQAVALDPVNPATRIYLGFALNDLRRFAEAEAQFRRVVELNPTIPWGYAGVSVTFIHQGRFDEAAAEAVLETNDWSRLLALTLARWGQKKLPEADAALAQLVKDNADVAAYQIAEVHAFRHDNDRAFEWLERAYRQHDAGLAWSKPDFLMESLHADPRWDAFMRKLGLADDQLK